MITCKAATGGECRTLITEYYYDEAKKFQGGKK